MTERSGLYELRTEAGVHVTEPDHQILADHIGALASPRNTYLRLDSVPAGRWNVTITLPAPGTSHPYEGLYRVDFRDQDEGPWSCHRDDPAEIARRVMAWISSRLL